jgi:hypothetical protein
VSEHHPASSVGWRARGAAGRALAATTATAGPDATRESVVVYEQGTERAVKVGIIDTGVDASHPDIAPNFDHRLSRNFTTDDELVPSASPASRRR